MKIDIHAHIIPEIDDGALNMKQADEMLQVSAQDDVGTIILTPHYSKDLQKIIVEKAKQLEQLAEKHGIKLLSGCEYDYSQVINQDELITLGDNKFVLIDLYSVAAHRQQAFERVIKNLKGTGYRFILAHPERSFGRKNRKDLQTLRDAGMFFQLSAACLLGEHGSNEQRNAHFLLRHGFGHYVATDVHYYRIQPKLLSRCEEMITEKYGEKTAQILFYENPERLLRGEPPMDIRPRRNIIVHMCSMFGIWI
ncbi:hypothetical protein P0136_13280 [Lentisphaerota bacterium ZTH]|nr:hypothetical protein JYG24_09205 [Lentisphaerota bacterium]WET06331.1 hypothetical protein P0136_13280 [Lentisphaerota bacterium ZTH]